MKKQIFFSFTLVILVLCGVFGVVRHFRNTAPTVPNSEPAPVQQTDETPIRAVWVNYNTISMKAQGGGEEADFRRKAEKICADIRASGLHTVILQVRPFCDALYPSAYFPWSAYLTGTQGQAVAYDPLAVFLSCAEAQGLSVQAWLNPYRVLPSTDWTQLSEKNPAKRWYKNGEMQNLLLTGEGIYLNPASLEVQNLILNGVREILETYTIEAIHLDDYFYPTTDAAVDAESYAAYRTAGGVLPLADWRRENINSFMQALYATVKSVNPAVQVVVSPCGDIDRNYHTLYADVERWARETGYLDVLMPQLYYGFENEKLPFAETARRWSELPLAEGVRLCYGLAAYKCGASDVYAGTGKSEWLQNDDMLARQVAFCRTLRDGENIAFYSYSNIYRANFEENLKKEWKNLENMLQ